MSALQTFLLVVDQDKEEAKQIAEQIAQGITARRTNVNDRF
jgi:DNA repair/transcription protein MET18/MMS19